MAVPRWFHSATVLPNGKVLVAGGVNDANDGGPLSSAELFTVVRRPTITKLSPTRGRRGVAVTIRGMRFGSRRSASTVRFGTKVCTRYLSWSARLIKVRVPARAAFGSVNVRVRTTAGLSNVKRFRVVR
jgi:hypothetical protein